MDLVVGVDESDASLTAVRWAAGMAKERRRGLRLVHAVDEIPVTYPHIHPAYQDLHRLISARGRRVLRHAKAAAAEVAPDVKPEIVLRPERPAHALLAESRTAAMLILGTPGLRPLGRIVLGSASVALAAQAECPVALVRPHVADDAPPDRGPVVLGVDGAPAGEDAIAIAFEEASWRQAPLVAIHCWHTGFLAEVFEEGGWTMDTIAIERHECELLAQRLAGWQEKYPDVSVDQIVRQGRSTRELLGWADRAQLLVVGSRGRGGLAGLTLGSTSQAMMSYALCPVIVARGRSLPHRK